MIDAQTSMDSFRSQPFVKKELSERIFNHSAFEKEIHYFILSSYNLIKCPVPRATPDEFHYYIIKIFYSTARAGCSDIRDSSLHAYYLQVVHYSRVHRNWYEMADGIMIDAARLIYVIYPYSKVHKLIETYPMTNIHITYSVRVALHFVSIIMGTL